MEVHHPVTGPAPGSVDTGSPARRDDKATNEDPSDVDREKDASFEGPPPSPRLSLEERRARHKLNHPVSPNVGVNRSTRNLEASEIRLHLTALQREKLASSPSSKPKTLKYFPTSIESSSKDDGETSKDDGEAISKVPKEQDQNIQSDHHEKKDMPVGVQKEDEPLAKLPLDKGDQRDSSTKPKKRRAIGWLKLLVCQREK